MAKQKKIPYEWCAPNIRNELKELRALTLGLVEEASSFATGVVRLQ
eukprot:CAMPEP_0172377726 /NCGR_PEP_ID=MMETSP1060-20121228/69062_1 /TAXON_ID=37318 /ORGANISM="Pseudo-nitzschia pungens, Strain cf. cingulata" /LENGTH=45 /DNA_ID= /DNA_START= /DNA_END= /DNA_ORIENTATION=